MLVTAEYVFDPTDIYQSDVVATAIVATSSDLPTVTSDDGILKAGETMFAAIPSGPEIVGMIMMANNGAATSNLLLWYQNEGITGLPFTPSGKAASITWNANGIIRVP